MICVFCLCSWLQPDRAVDPEASELVLPDEPVKTGLSSNFTIHTKDQDGKLVYVDGMKVRYELCVEAPLDDEYILYSVQKFTCFCFVAPIMVIYQNQLPGFVF